MTAVEWLVEKLHKRWYGLEEGETWNDLIKQALEMEKQQIIDAYIEGYSIPEYLADAIQYYDITYKTNNP
jgi:hypothetical protein